MKPEELAIGSLAVLTLRSGAEALGLRTAPGEFVGIDKRRISGVVSAVLVDVECAGFDEDVDACPQGVPVLLAFGGTVKVGRRLSQYCFTNGANVPFKRPDGWKSLPVLRTAAESDASDLPAVAVAEAVPVPVQVAGVVGAKAKLKPKPKPEAGE